MSCQSGWQLISYIIHKQNYYSFVSIFITKALQIKTSSRFHKRSRVILVLWYFINNIQGTFSDGSTFISNNKLSREIFIVDVLFLKPAVVVVFYP